MRVNTFAGAVVLLIASACANGPTRGQYDDPEFAARAENAWLGRLTEADLERLAQSAGDRLEGCAFLKERGADVDLLPVEDRTGKNADTVVLADRLQGRLRRGGKVRVVPGKASFVLASVLTMDSGAGEYRLALTLASEPAGGGAGGRCEETVVLPKTPIRTAP